MGFLTTTMNNTQNRGYQAYDDVTDTAVSYLDTATSPFQAVADGIGAAWENVSELPGDLLDAAGDTRDDIKDILGQFFDVAKYGALAYAVAMIASMPLAYYAFRSGMFITITKFVGDLLNAVIRGVGLVV